MPLWMRADRRMMLDFVLKIEDCPRLEPLLPKPASLTSRIAYDAASKPSASSDERPTKRLLPALGENAFSDEVTVPTELRLAARLMLGLGFGADRAVRYSASLISASMNSSISSELFPSKPANKLLIRGGLRMGALWCDSGPSSLFPG
jgi:hypothetical protein